MKTFALLITLVLTIASARAGVVAGPLTNAANGHLYYLLDTDTWTNSEAQAVALGGHLVTVNDAAENQWLVDTFAHYGGVMRPLWIGLTDREVEGDFRWISGEPVDYTNWNTLTGEPNNSGGGDYEEDFAYIIEEFSGNPSLLSTFWNDVPEDGAGAHSPMYGVVEVIPGVIPVPVPEVRFGRLYWDTVEGVAYQAQCKPAPSRGAWIDFGPVVIGTGDEVSLTGVPRPGHNRIYRVLVLE